MEGEFTGVSVQTNAADAAGLFDYLLHSRIKVLFESPLNQAVKRFFLLRTLSLSVRDADRLLLRLRLRIGRTRPCAVSCRNTRCARHSRGSRRTSSGM